MLIDDCVDEADRGGLLHHVRVSPRKPLPTKTTCPLRCLLGIEASINAENLS
jgi:hypothetical protein